MKLENSLNKDKAVDNKIDIIKDVKEEYVNIENLFLMEDLSNNIEIVKEQMENLKNLLEKYYGEIDLAKINGDSHIDNGDLIQKIIKAFSEFIINGKQINILELSNEYDFRAMYNDLVYEINGHFDLYAMKERHLESM